MIPYVLLVLARVRITTDSLFFSRRKNLRPVPPVPQEGFFGVDCSLSLGADGQVLTSYERWAMANPPKEQEQSLDSGSLKSNSGESGVSGVRPRVYVYELPQRFTSHLLYAHHPLEYNSIYSAGRFLHMRLLASEFRTTDPEQADYFFVPVWGRAAGSGPPRYRSKYLIEVRAASYLRALV